MGIFSLFSQPKPSNAFSFDNGVLRFVSVMRREGVVHIETYWSEDFSSIVDSSDNVIDESKFVSRLAALAAQHKILSANIVVPDARAVCFHTHVAKAPERQMTDVITDHLATYCEAHGLLSYAEYLSEYEIILETQFGYDVHATLVPKLYLEHLVRLFKQAGIAVPHIETAHHAVARSCVNVPTGTGYVAVFVGKNKTTVSVVNGQHLVSHDVVAIGTQTIIQTVESYLRVSHEEASRIISRYGVLKTHPDNGMLSELYKRLSPIVQSIDKQLINLGQMPYKTYGYRFVTNHVLVYGEGVGIKGLVAMIGEETGLSARALDVWAGRSDRAPIQNLPASDTPNYAEALSLALLYLK